MSDGRPIQVGVCGAELTSNAAQLRRIAQASGAEPLLWDGQTPAPEMEVLFVAEAPDTVPHLTPRLRLVQLLSAGADSLPGTPLWRSDVALATASGVHGVQIAEHVLMLMLALRRDLPGLFEAQRRHDWMHDVKTPDELYGLTLGLVGYGHIGRGVAHLARAFGMRVLATSASATDAALLDIVGASPFVDLPAIPGPHNGPDEMLPLARLHDMLAQADVVVICAPLTARTSGLIDASALRRMKRGSHLINIARGKIVDEAALVDALREGRLAGAGLDVTAEEPLPAASPLWALRNVIVTPHVSGKSNQYVERAVNILLTNLERLRRGEPPLTNVDRGRGY